MSEIMRAVLEKSSIASRPCWYSSDVTFSLAVSNTELYGVIKTEQYSHFLMTSYFIDGIVYDAGMNKVQKPISQGSFYGRFGLSNLDTHRKYYQNTTVPDNISTNVEHSLENYEYVYMPPNSRIQWKMTDILVGGAANTLNIVVLLTGIEYLMPDDKISSFANV